MRLQNYGFLSIYANLFAEKCKKSCFSAYYLHIICKWPLIFKKTLVVSIFFLKFAPHYYNKVILYRNSN